MNWISPPVIDARWEAALKESSALRKAAFIINRAIDEGVARDMKGESNDNREFYVSASEHALLLDCGVAFTKQLDRAKVVVV
jgi:hypothetical protein